MTAVEIEESQSRKIARLQLQVTPSVRHTLRIARPTAFRDSEWTEQYLPSELVLTHSRCVLDDSRQQVVVGAAVAELRTWLRPHRHLQGVSDPVRALLHREELAFVASEATIESGLHCQQILHGNSVATSVGRSGCGRNNFRQPLRKRELADVDCSPNQNRRDALGNRRDVVPTAACERIEAAVKHYDSAAHNKKAVNRNVTVAQVQQRICQECRAESL